MATWTSGVTLDDFEVRLGRQGPQFVFLPTGQTWRRSGVDAALPPVDGVRASAWLMQHRMVLTDRA
jgi:hypothetical protein